jgi:hypothetical protein
MAEVLRYDISMDGYRPVNQSDVEILDNLCELVKLIDSLEDYAPQIAWERVWEKHKELRNKRRAMAGLSPVKSILHHRV